MGSFNELLSALAEEHCRQLATIQAENCNLRRQLDRRDETAQATEHPAFESSPTLVKEASSVTQHTSLGPRTQCTIRIHSHGSQNTDSHSHADPAQLKNHASRSFHDQADSQQLKDHASKTFHEQASHRSAVHTIVSTIANMRFASVAEKSDELEDRIKLQNDHTTRGRVKRLMASNAVEILVAMVVAVSAVISALELQYNGTNAGFLINYPGIDLPSSQTWPGAADTFAVLDHVFTGIFAIELILRVFAFRMEFFLVFLNWLDVASVVVGVVDLCVNEKGSGAGVLRLMRLVKLSRALRLVRMLSVLESLLFLLECLKASVATLFWSLCVLIIVQCIVGMLLSQIVQNYIRGADEDVQLRQEVFEYYGTFTRTIITMFEIHLANWAPACRVLVNNIGEWLGYLFLAYRCFAGFAVLNVINAVFIQQTMKVAQQDHEVKMAQKERAQRQSRREIMEFFEELDKSGDGRLSQDEFNKLVTDERLQTWLRCLDVDMTDVSALIEMMEPGDHQISAVEFVQRLQNIKGPAKAIDMAQLLSRAKRLESKVNWLAAITQGQQQADWVVSEDELAPPRFDIK